MPDVLAVILLSAVTLLVPATLLVFTVGPSSRRVARLRPVEAVAGALVVALATIGLGGLLGTGPVAATTAGVALGGSVLCWAPLCRAWDTRGLVAWALTLDAGVSYLAYVAVWTATAEISPVSTVASGLLLLVEAWVLVIGAGYVWEFIDVLARREWPAFVDPRQLTDGDHRPFVSLHVPTHNEPPHLVIATLERLLQQRYDAFEIVLVDNNTTDPALWRPVEAFCASHERITFLHVEDLRGYKSGALNLALRHTDPRAEVIGIIDADYLVDPDFLAHCTRLFADPAISFVQTPQDYREWEAAPYFRRLYHSYGYFFEVSQKSRNERNGAIFGGTMGLIRRSDLEAVGGWDEWCITEDAELSLRLLRAGGRGVHVDRSYGNGVMPLTFEALKRQRFRWCFGGVQILRLHWRSLLPGRRTPANQLTAGQRWAYLVGGLQWFGDVASVLFSGFLLLGALDLVLGTGVVVRRLSGLLLVCVAVLLVLGAVRSLALLRRTSGASWGEAAGAFGLWLALGWVVAQGAVRGLFAREGVFLRTPKVRGELRAMHALRGNLTETVLGLLLAAVGAVAIAQPTAPATMVGAILLVQATGLLLAPANSLAAIRADLPEELRQRRRVMLTSWGVPARRGGLVLAAGGAALMGLVVLAAPVTAPDLAEIGPDREPAAGPRVDPVSPSPSVPSRQGATAPALIASPVVDARTVEPVSQRPRRSPTPGAPVTTDGGQLLSATPQAGPATPPSQPPPAPPTPTSPAQHNPPSSTPIAQPTQQPSGRPTSRPTNARPTTTPSSKPTTTPSSTPTGKP